MKKMFIHLYKQTIIGCFLLISSYCTASPLTGYWEGHISYAQKQWKIAVEFSNDKRQQAVAHIDFPEIGGYRRLFTLTQMGQQIRMERLQPNGRPTLIFTGTVLADVISGNFEGIGINAAHFQIKPATKIRFDSEGVFFNNDSIRLAGTLLTPGGNGPFPAVVLTHGSGPDTRDLYYGIAMDFVKNGVAALIYDKRGLGQSTGGDYQLAGFTGLARDALAGVELLKNRSRINASMIGVFGHSQGGWIAPMAASLSKDVAFVICSAASPVTASEQSVYHRMNVMRQEGFNDSVITKAAGIRERWNAATKLCYVDSNTAKEEIMHSLAEIAAVKNEPWFAASALPEFPYPGCPQEPVLELLFKEPVDIWKKVKVPVYAVWGAKDIVVPVEKRHIIAYALHNSGNKKASFRVIPNTDHSFLLISADDDWDFPRQVPDYFTDMADWVKKLVK